MNFRLDYAEIEKRKSKKEEKKKEPAVPTNEIVSVAGKRVVVTGSVPGMTRLQVERFLARHNTTVQASVMSNTHYLIVGNTRGSQTTKLRTAAQLGVKVIQAGNVREFKQR